MHILKVKVSSDVLSAIFLLGIAFHIHVDTMLLMQAVAMGDLLLFMLLRLTFKIQVMVQWA